MKNGGVAFAQEIFNYSSLVRDGTLFLTHRILETNTEKSDDNRSSPVHKSEMDRMNTHSTNNNGLLSRSESRSAATTSSPSQFDLQWGSRKGLRCMKVHGKDHSTSNDSTGSRTVRRATARIDRRAVRSDTDNNAGKDPITNRSGGGHLNLRQRPASPSRRILRNSEEKEEDFLAIKGSKLPQRPKKRAKFIQRTLNLVSPGAWLCDLTLERYEVREKKRPRGIKAMGNMESDSE
ncbi:hypothetical protein STAS_08628 [Striga asiatica]|uniref:Uncharacterized protein n=1 Tax=Striga asiatica TaxID=4170 RepID=A0A5A7PI48_STRAF|nr:hypothetical protein STAS_08628 [Striga asiatica]